VNTKLKIGVQVQTPDGIGRVLSIREGEISVRLPLYTRTRSGGRRLPDYAVRTYAPDSIQPVDGASIGDRVFVSAVVGSGVIINIVCDQALVRLAGSEPRWIPLAHLTLNPGQTPSWENR
jgi:hypothetical protein